MLVLVIHCCIQSNNYLLTLVTLTFIVYWRRKWQPTPVFLPGKFHGLRSLVGYSPWGQKEVDTTERLDFTPQFNNNISQFLQVRDQLGGSGWGLSFRCPEVWHSRWLSWITVKWIFRRPQPFTTWTSPQGSLNVLVTW